MGLKLAVRVAELNRIPDELRPFYASDPTDASRYVLQVEPADGLEIVKEGEAEELLAELRQERQARKHADKLAAAATREEQVSAEVERLAEERLDALRERLAAEQVGLERQNERLTEQLLEESVKAAARKEVVRFGGDPRFLGAHVEARLSSRMSEGGRVQVHAIDDAGQPREVGGQVLDAEAVVREMAADPDFAGYLKAAPTGSALPAMTITRGDAQIPDRFVAAVKRAEAEGRELRMVDGDATPAPTSTISWRDAKDVAKYEAAKAAAEKEGRVLVVEDEPPRDPDLLYSPATPDHAPPSGKTVVRISSEDARDVARYRAAKKAATAQGLELIVED